MKSFQFLTIGDVHYRDEACEPWCGGAMAAMNASAPEASFCLALGDLSDSGTPDQCAAMRALLGKLGMPMHPVPGNHDYRTDDDRAAYDAAFPGMSNYRFDHAGWQFIGLDTTAGVQWEGTRIPQKTLEWLAEERSRLDAGRPTVVFTHFPVGEGVTYRPANADALLALLAGLNIRAVISGHWHGHSTRAWGDGVLMTQRCCSPVCENHDGSPEKGWCVWRAEPGGELEWRFVAFDPEIAAQVSAQPER